MSQQTHLFKRNSCYYFRAKVPIDLQRHLGKREEKFSLKTKDRQEAKRLARQASADFDRRCQRLRRQVSARQGPGRPRVIDDALIQEICALWRHQVLAGDEYSRQEGWFSGELDERSGEREATREALREALRHSRLERIEPALQTFLHLLRVELRGDESRYRALLYRFLQTATEVHDQQLARDAGEVVWTPQAPATAIAPGTQDMLTLDGLFEDWRRVDPRRPQRTVTDVRGVVDGFQGLVGKKDARSIDRQDVVRYRDDLIGRGLRSKTVNKKIAFLCALFNVGINNGRLIANPAQRVPIPKSASRRRKPFTRDDLKRIFGSPVYTRGKRFGRRVGEASAWIPLLALYHGCRVEELAQLLIEDVQRIDGIWCLSIDDMPGAHGERKRLKNDDSRRELPLHPKVIETGFLRYVARLRDAGKTRVFPALEPDRFGKHSSAFSKAFMTYLRRTLGFTDPRKVFHSFRHTFRDACRAARIDEEIADALMGHSSSDRTGRYYGSNVPLWLLHEAIGKIRYPGVTVPVLMAEDD